MKVLHVVNCLGMGGAEKLIVETVPMYLNKGIETDVLVLKGDMTPFYNQLEGLGICSIYSLGKSYYNPLNIFKIIPYLKRYDIIHVHLFPAQYFVVLAKIISFSKTKLVFTEHSTSNRRIRNKFFSYIERFIYSSYSKIICISEEVKLVFEKYTRLDSDRFDVISNGVYLKSIQEALILDKNKIHNLILDSDKLLVQIARFNSEKDQKTLIKAMCYLDVNIKLILVGEGVLKEDCQKITKELGLYERVFFLGVRTDVPSLLKTADISVVSSHWEGFGLVAVEGMAAGKPVIASNVAGLSNVVKGAGVLFEKGNEKELALKIQELLDNEDYYNKVVKDGYERAKQYDINAMVERQLGLYAKLLK